jgi:hypothetical protein
MFQVVPEPEFSAWYEALPEPIAEEVTTAIDLVASAGAGLEPERLSRLLLWYDGTGDGTSLARLGLALVPHLQTSAALMGSYLMWHHEVLLCLESPSFQDRLTRLEHETARRALLLVERLKRQLHAARLAGNARGVRELFLDLLELVGLEPELALCSGSGLRELTIDNTRPQLRVLFGLDFPAKRLLAILGEPLSRSYYGDSIRRAEQRWQQYCEGVACRLSEAR